MRGSRGVCVCVCVWGGGGGGGGWIQIALKNHKTLGFLSNTGPEPLKNHMASSIGYKASIQCVIGQLVKRHLNVILLVAQ